MAVPFHIPEEQSDTDLILNQKLLDLYHLLYQILIHRRQPIHENLQSVIEQTPEAIIPLTPSFASDLDVRNAIKKTKLMKKYVTTKRQNYKKEITETDSSRPISPSTANIHNTVTTVYQDWTQVGRNLRQIADNFHCSYTSYTDEPKTVDYLLTNPDLITTIVSISPFRDSIWSAVFVVGCQMLANTR